MTKTYDLPEDNEVKFWDAFDDVLESVALAMRSAGVDESVITEVTTTVTDACVNNLGDDHEPDTKTYEVSVSNFFDAKSPKDAVKQMTTWLIDNAWVAGYRVTLEYKDEYVGDDLRAPDTWFIDAEEMGRTT